ncbi:MAG: DUF4215 domain-containing protein, partial [Thermodesulfobacteriota bacterium]
CTVTPPPAPVCGDGNVDAGEQCDDGNSTNGDGCESDCTITPPPAPVCGDGTSLVITEMDFDRGDEKLHIKGRASAGTTISIIDSDNGEILADDIMVREGRWEAEIEDVDDDLERISVISSNGCVVDQDVDAEEEEEEEEEERS